MAPRSPDSESPGILSPGPHPGLWKKSLDVGPGNLRLMSSLHDSHTYLNFRSREECNSLVGSEACMLRQRHKLMMPYTFIMSSILECYLISTFPQSNQAKYYLHFRKYMIKALEVTFLGAFHFIIPSFWSLIYVLTIYIYIYIYIFFFFS